MIIFIGIDPAINSLGLGFIADKEIYSDTLISTSDDIQGIYDIVTKLKQHIFLAYYFDSEVFITCEQPYLLGKGHDTLMKLLGIIEYELFDKRLEIHFVHPMTLKKYFGSGKFGKKQLANMIKNKLSISTHQKYIDKLIDLELWDETDALAIAIYGKEVIYGRALSKND